MAEGEISSQTWKDVAVVQRALLRDFTQKHEFDMSLTRKGLDMQQLPTDNDTLTERESPFHCMESIEKLNKVLKWKRTAQGTIVFHDYSCSESICAYKFFFGLLDPFRLVMNFIRLGSV